MPQIDRVAYLKALKVYFNTRSSHPLMAFLAAYLAEARHD